MDTLAESWTERGLLHLENGVPVALHSEIWVELGEALSGPTAPGPLVAALAELTARLGLQLLSMPRKILGELFVDGLADGRAVPVGDAAVVPPSSQAPVVVGAAPRAAVGSAQGGTRLVLAMSENWLRGVLPGTSAVDAVCSQKSMLDDASGLIAVVDNHYLVVTARSHMGLLAAVRYLVSEAYGAGLPQQKVAVVAAMQTVNGAGGLPQQRADGQLSPGESCDASRSAACAPSLDHLFGVDGVYQNTGDVLPKLQVAVVLRPQQAAAEPLLELVARFALGAGAVRFPLTYLAASEQPSESVCALEFDVQSEETAVVTPYIESRGETVRFVAASTAGMAELVSGVIDAWFEAGDYVSRLDWRGKLAAVQSTYPDVAMRARVEMTLEGALRARPFTSVNVSQSLGVGLQAWAMRQHVALAARPAPLMWTVDWTDAGELDALEQRLWAVWPDLQKAVQGGPDYDNDRIEVEVLTSVSASSFARWAASIREQMQEKLLGDAALSGSSEVNQNHSLDVTFVYRDVYKAGLHWFLQDVLPQLTTHRGVDGIDISARRFEIGATALELPQRFLQEMFPADAILAKRMAIPIERIRLQLHDADGPMFQVVAKDATGAVLQQWTWDGMTEVLAYVPFEVASAGEPDPDEARCVCVPSAGLRITRVLASGKRETMVTEAVSTNYTRFWRWFQTQIVDKIPVMALSQQDGPGHRAANGPTPFERLAVDVCIDGSEVRTGIHEEFTSFPEALHEDIYFYTLQRLQAYGRVTGNRVWDSPGSIIPYIHIREGAPRARIQMYGYDSDLTLTVAADDGSWEVPVCAKIESERHVHIHRVAWTGSGWTVLELSGAPAEVLEPLRLWLNGNEGLDVQQAKLSSAGEQARAGAGPSQRAGLDSERDILHNEDIAEWIADHRQQIPGRGFALEYSFQGRPIWALELMTPVRATQLTSRAKQMLYKPTLFITARHHANEVSSTNAALWLLQCLVENPRQLEAFNLVIVPLQNVDGAALHADLVEEHPYWKHHAARFNACGLEFARDYFRPDTPFGESRTMKLLWDLWKPDLYLDDHGIPSHEWIQPFSGYSSPPSFPVSYWIPHAQMYTIWHQLEGEQPSRDQSLSEQIASRLAHDDAVHSVNQEFLTRYLRWGHAFAPAKFPVDTVDGVITYRSAVKPDANGRNLIARFPDWVTADLVTEVNDETVHGDALHAVARAHQLVHEAILRWLEGVAVRVNCSLAADADGVVVALARKRPLAQR